MKTLKKAIERMNGNDIKHIATNFYYDNFDANKDYLSTCQQNRIKGFIKQANVFGLTNYEAIEVIEGNYLYNNNTLAFTIRHVLGIKDTQMHGRELASLLGVYFCDSFKNQLRGMSHTHPEFIANYTDTHGLDLISFK